MFKLQEIKITNFKSINYAEIKFAKSKTVFVWKNSVWKSNILKAVELFFSGNHNSINISSFNDVNKELRLEAIITKDWNEFINLIITAKIENNEVKIKYEENYDEEERIKIHDFLSWVDFLYIPSNRSFLNKNSNWYKKMIDMILRNKAESIENKEVMENLKNIVLSVKYIIKDPNNTLSFNNDKNFPIKQTEESNILLENLNEFIKNEDFWDIKNLNNISLSAKNSLFIALFDLYYKSLSWSKNQRFKIFIIDHVENFLHPHSIRLIDKVLQDIADTENTQIIYSTHANELVSNFKKDKYEIDSVRFVYKLHWFTNVKQIKNKYGDYERIMLNLMFKSSDVFFSDAVILVEGETEKISIPNIFEYYPWNQQDLEDCKLDMCKSVVWKNRINDFFNIYLKNIAVIDVWWKGALSDWYEFCSELLWKRNVFAIIDRDNNFHEDKRNIERSIKRVYWRFVKEYDYINYNWIVLDWEFENYYKAEKIKEYLSTVLKEKYKNDAFLQKEINQLIYKIEHLKIHKKVSVSYERLFKTYLRWFWKPTIAFNLSIWLCQNDWYKQGLMQILKKIIYKVEENKEIDGN